MTVVSSSSTITFSGDGVQTLFDFNFRIFREDDLSAVVRSNGESRRLTAGTDFKIVSGIGNDSGGRVQYPVSGDLLPSGDRLTLFREIPYSQELELVDNDPFSASLLNETFDRGVMRDQQLQEQLDRALKYDISTPEDELLTPQVFMQRIVEARDNSLSALSEAEQARTETLTAKDTAETARSGAVAAQNAAEAAKDSAQQIAFGELAALRSKIPVLFGAAEAAEGATVVLSITDHIDDGETSYDIDVSGFGSVTVSGGTISWKLGFLDVDTFHWIKVVRRRRGEVYSETASHQVLVKKVEAQDGSTVVFANNDAGWNKEPDVDGFQPPAYSVEAENQYQVVSAKMEVVQTSGELNLLDGSTAETIKTSDPDIKVGDDVVADTGVGKVTNIIEDVPATVNNSQPFGDNSCLATYQFNDSGVSLGPNGSEITSGIDEYIDLKYGKGAKINGSNTGLGVTVNFDNFGFSWSFNNGTTGTNDAAINFVNNSNFCGVLNGDSLYLPGGSTWAIPVEFKSLFSEDKLHHMVITGTKETGVKLYIDNQVILHTPEYSTIGSGTLYQLGFGTSPGNMNYDQLRFFNRALTAEEVTKLGNETDAIRNITVTPAFFGVPTKVFKKVAAQFALGAGITGEYLGPETSLKFKSEELVPQMTSNVSGGFTVSASSIANATAEPFTMFNAEPDDTWLSLSGQPESWINVKKSSGSASPHTLVMKARTGQNPERTPKDFIVKGRKAGGSWQTLATVTNQIDWTLGEERRFALSAFDADEWQTDISASSDAAYSQIGGLQFLSSPGDKSNLIFESSKSIKSNIFVPDGKHNKLKVGGVDVEVSGVSEEQVEDSTTVEILSNQGSFIHSTLDPASVAKYPDMNPFNSDVGETYQKGFCGQNGRAALKDFIGAEFTVPTSIAGIYFQQYQAAANDVSKVMIRKSDDGTTWGDVKEFDVSTNNANQLLRLDSAVSAKYWALLATTNTGNGGEEYPWLIQYARWVAPAASFLTTATLATPLAQAPTTDTAVSIPDRCTLTPAALSAQVVGGELKITADMIELADDPSLKRLAMAVNGSDELRFKDAKIYIREKV